MSAYLRKKVAAPGQPADFSRQQALQCIPLKNPEIRELENEKGEVRLIYQIRIKPWFATIFKSMSGRPDSFIERKLQLDLLGSTVWRMIDGQKSVGDLAVAFQAEHQLTGLESEISVTTFLRQLGKRGLIAMREK